MLMGTEKNPLKGFIKKTSLKGRAEIHLLMLLDASGQSLQEEQWNCCFTMNAEKISMLHREKRTMANTPRDACRRRHGSTPTCAGAQRRCRRVQFCSINPPTRSILPTWKRLFFPPALAVRDNRVFVWGGQQSLPRHGQQTNAVLVS